MVSLLVSCLFLQLNLVGVHVEIVLSVVHRLFVRMPK